MGENTVYRLEKELALAKLEARQGEEKAQVEAEALAKKEAKEAAEVEAWARSKFPPMTHLKYQI